VRASDSAAQRHASGGLDSTGGRTGPTRHGAKPASHTATPIIVQVPDPHRVEPLRGKQRVEDDEDVIVRDGFAPKSRERLMKAIEALPSATREATRRE
jgi:hypothetical protein